MEVYITEIRRVVNYSKSADPINFQADLQSDRRSEPNTVLVHICRRSADYPQCVATSGLVKCGKGVVTWFSASANHMHSAQAFRILPSPFRILPGPCVHTYYGNAQINYSFLDNSSMTTLHNKPTKRTV